MATRSLLEVQTEVSVSSASQARGTKAAEAAEFSKQQNDFAHLAACVAHYLDGGRSQSCRVVWSGRKMGKFIVEFAVETEPGAARDLRRWIGKISKSDRGQGHFAALSRLREAGFRPPSPFTVVYPIAYVADRCLLLQEKAPGRLLADIILGESSAAAVDASERTAGWLAALHAATVDAQPRLDHVRESVARHGRGLMD